MITILGLLPEITLSIQITKITLADLGLCSCYSGGMLNIIRFKMTGYMSDSFTLNKYLSHSHNRAVLSFRENGAG